MMKVFIFRFFEDRERMRPSALAAGGAVSTCSGKVISHSWYLEAMVEVIIYLLLIIQSSRTSCIAIFAIRSPSPFSSNAFGAYVERMHFIRCHIDDGAFLATGGPSHCTAIELLWRVYETMSL